MDTSTCITFRHNKSPILLVDDKLVISFDGVSFES